MLCYLKIYCKYIIYFTRMYLFVMFFKENYIFIIKRMYIKKLKEFRRILL